MYIQKEKTEAEENDREDKATASAKERVIFQLCDSQNIIETFELSEEYILKLRRQLIPPYRLRQIDDFDLEEILSKEYDIDSDSLLLDKSRNIRMFLQDKKCVFIKEQRIITSTQEYEHNRLLNRYEIDDIAKQLIKEFTRQQTEFASESQKIDSTFIKRLVNKMHNTYDEKTFQKKLSALKTKINCYRNYGLMPQIDILEEYPEDLQNVLSLYIDDMERKMSSFDKFYKQLSLFDRFVSDKILSNKRIKLNENKGITVLNGNEEEIPLHKLSSGEQNLIILCYKLAFATDTRTVLLIDELENSLHMAWISRMLDDYQQMAKDLKCQIIIATHSPAFINDCWDLSCDLFANNKENN